MAKQSKKEVTVIARYQFKADPKKVAYLVRASNGKDTYQVFFFAGKACSCGCPAKKPCYHMTQLETREASRNQISERDAALAAARAESEALLAQIDAEVQEQIEAEQSAPVAPKSEMAQFADLPLSEDEQREIEKTRDWLDELDDDAKHRDWTADELAALNGNRHNDDRIIPAQMNVSPTSGVAGRACFFPNM
jgi:hypothetical protein